MSIGERLNGLRMPLIGGSALTAVAAVAITTWADVRTLNSERISPERIAKIETQLAAGGRYTKEDSERDERRIIERMNHLQAQINELRGQLRQR